MVSLKEIKYSLLHLIFPHLCSGCGSDKIDDAQILCMRCIASLPETGFENYMDNPAEKLFWGRLNVRSATASFYFTKESMMQHLMHQFKYKSNKEIGLQLGKMMGQKILASGRFEVDALIPLPLFAIKEKKRGYNQATVLCEGISDVLRIPVLDDVIVRPQHTETQTKKGRIERWKNIEGRFLLKEPSLLTDLHVLLVDDVITTGATIESCGSVVLEAPGVKLSVAALCIASR